MGAYLVGSRGTPQQAVFLGLTVTITHTLGVYALGLVTLLAADRLLPERLYPLLGAISGLLVATIGLTLLRRRLGTLLRGRGQAVGASLRQGQVQEPAYHGLSHSHGGHAHGTCRWEPTTGRAR